jgi:hypothetical protein
LYLNIAVHDMLEVEHHSKGEKAIALKLSSFHPLLLYCQSSKIYI